MAKEIIITKELEALILQVRELLELLVNFEERLSNPKTTREEIEELKVYKDLLQESVNIATTKFNVTLKELEMLLAITEDFFEPDYDDTKLV